MSLVPSYPDFAPVALEMGSELDPFCKNLAGGVCEFVFANLFLCRNKYTYRIARVGRTYVLSGIERQGGASGIQGRFFSILGEEGLRDNRDAPEIIAGLFETHDFWKSLTVPQKELFGDMLAQKGCAVQENRANFDYLYLRTDLAELRGKKFHKKKNLVNAFNAAYSSGTQKINKTNAPDVMAILNTWERLHAGDQITDYEPCSQALAHMDELGLDGLIVYAEGKPAAFSLGETMAAGTMYCVHFEKGIDAYKGIYQFVNQQEALALPESVTYINREQDVGDEGLRQAKLTYRPAAFVEKYVAFPPGK